MDPRALAADEQPAGAAVVPAAELREPAFAMAFKMMARLSDLQEFQFQIPEI